MTHFVVDDSMGFQILCFGAVESWCCCDGGKNSGRFVRDVDMVNVVSLWFVSSWRFQIEIRVVDMGNGHMEWSFFFISRRRIERRNEHSSILKFKITG